jgi:glycyl-tRNA synthetase beta chain
MPDFLLEIGCEEIPGRMVDAASAELEKRVTDLLQRERLEASSVARFDTPRRLAVLARNVASAQPDVTEKLTGPSVTVAYKDGQPTPAANAFAKKAGIDVSQLQRVTTPKGEYLSATVTKNGRKTKDILVELLPKEINSIYWPKNMYWAKPTERFVRPVRWLVAMLDGEVVPLELDGILAGNTTRGHRQLGRSNLTISSAGDYSATLEKGKVLGRDQRLAQIRKALDASTRSIAGARWREDAALLETVVNLTEWPSVILGNFDPEFLSLPQEVLVTVMRDHQKYFDIEDSSGKLLPHFLAVLNTDGDPSGTIRHGHERVLRARFNDARFFWQTDQQHPLRERALWLKNVTFQKDLGTYHEKTLRVQRLCSWISEALRQKDVPVRPGVIHKAALLAKADLTTELVKEFTELQGIVGGLYAAVQNLDKNMPIATRQAIADAVYDHYRPESMDDSSPRSTEGAVLAIADKADSIAGMFALGLQPTGSKDPFALRRQANGIVKTIAEHKLPISLRQLFNDARETYRGSKAERKFVAKDASDAIRGFFRERVEFFLREAHGIQYDVVNAVLAAGADDVVDVLSRAQAVQAVLNVPEFRAIAAASKRVRNILKQASDKKLQIAAKFAVLPDSAPEEKNLAAYLESNAPAIEAHRQAREYPQALQLLSTAQVPVDAFFDKVMVMTENEQLRANRLALLQSLAKEFSTIADFSEIVIEGQKES